MPRFAASLTKAWSSVSRRAITGLAAVAEPDQRNVRALPARDRRHLGDLDRARDDLVAQRGNDGRHVIEPFRALVRDQHSQVLVTVQGTTIDGRRTGLSVGRNRA